MASKINRPTLIVGDTVVWLKHAGERRICGVGSDIPPEHHMFIMCPLADITALYKIVSVTKAAEESWE